MLEQLNTALSALEEAADGYLRTCQEVYDRYVAGQPINTIPRDLATGLPHQLSRIESLREKLKSVKKAVHRSMNASSSLVPIHALPEETLIHIFELAQGDGCINRCPRQRPTLPVLTSTCYYWRQLMLNSPAQWTHIDISVRFSYSLVSQIEHAKLCAGRAGHEFLHIHIIDRAYEPQERDKICALLAPFIGSIATRIQSFIYHMLNLSLEAHGLVFNELFKKCTSGALQVLDINTRFRDHPYYWDTDPHIGFYAYVFGERVWLVETSNERLEEIYKGINTLRLYPVFPRWTSSAYHGLVELRLKGHAILKCSESQLIGALRQSPGLRVFECELPPRSPLGLDVSVDPIALTELEVLNLGRNTTSDIEAIVRWLAPGPKPLQLLIRVPSLLGPRLVEFLTRSNITAAYVRANYPGGAWQLVSHLPHLQSLALADRRAGSGWNDQDDGDDGDDWDNGELEHGDSGAVSSASKTMYVIDFYLGGLHVFDRWPALELLHHILFHGCTLGGDTLSELSQINPGASIEIVPEEDRSPVADWELFAPYDLTKTSVS